MTGATASPRARAFALAAALFVGFFLLRAWAFDFESPPLKTHPDEVHYATVAKRLAWSRLNPLYFHNPPLFTYMLFLVKEAYRVTHVRAETAAWLADGGLFIAGRIASALLGALTPFLVGAAAFALFRSRAVRIAAIVITGCSFLHGRDSHFGVNDVPMTFFVAASLMFAARGLRGSGSRDLVLAAIAAGLAAATKYNGAVAFALAPVALLLRDWPRRRERGLGVIVRDVAILSVVPFVAYVAGNPYTLLAFDDFWSGFVGQYSEWGDRAGLGQSLAPRPLLYFHACRALLGVAGIAAVLAGIGSLLRKDRAALALLLVFPVFYLAAMLSKELFYWRFVLPLLPFFAVLAAFTCVEAARVVSRRSVVLAGVIVLVVAEPAASLIRHDVVLSRPSTWILAREWVMENVPRDAILFLEALPGAFAPEHTSFVLRERPDDLLRFADTRPGRAGPALKSGSSCYLVTDSRFEQSWDVSADPEVRQHYRAHYQRLRATLRPAAEFPPGGNGDPMPFVLDAMYSPLTDLWSIDRPGFTIRVYALNPSQYLDKLQPSQSGTSDGG